ncbi:MAG: hypothetical protein RR982_02260 [Kiritimatiellia bacterium]
MMRNESFNRAVTQLLEKETRFPRAAYHLLPLVLDATVRTLRGQRDEDSAPVHVNGKQLAEGFRDYMLAEYGPFASGILETMRIRSTEDIGTIVYLLISVGVFGKTESDSRDDFHAVYDFNETFVTPYKAVHE